MFYSVGGGVAVSEISQSTTSVLGQYQYLSSALLALAVGLYFLVPGLLRRQSRQVRLAATVVRQLETAQPESGFPAYRYEIKFSYAGQEQTIALGDLYEHQPGDHLHIRYDPTGQQNPYADLLNFNAVRLLFPAVGALLSLAGLLCLAAFLVVK